MRETMFHVSISKCSDCRSGMPSSAGSCDSAMTIAPALMNPISTGCETRLISMPARASPKPSWKIPDSNASSVT